MTVQGTTFIFASQTFTNVFKTRDLCKLLRKCSQRTEGRLNLNFQAHPYGVAFLNPSNMPKYPIKTLNSKINFRALKRANFFVIFWLNFLKTQFLNFWQNFEWNFGATVKNGPKIVDFRPKNKISSPFQTTNLWSEFQTWFSNSMMLKSCLACFKDSKKPPHKEAPKNGG